VGVVEFALLVGEVVGGGEALLEVRPSRGGVGGVASLPEGDGGGLGVHALGAVDLDAVDLAADLEWLLDRGCVVPHVAADVVAHHRRVGEVVRALVALLLSEQVLAALVWVCCPCALVLACLLGEALPPVLRGHKI